MRHISNNLQQVRPSATIAMSQKARNLSAQGVDVISLSAGEPDFDTPEHISEAAILAMAQGKTRYTAVDGIHELKEVICQKFKRDNQLNYKPPQINVSPGGKAVLFNALMATLNMGDQVIIPAPCWVSYPEMTRLCGAIPKIVFCGRDTGYKLNAEMLEQAITPNTKWLMLNSPSNPTGMCYSKTELQALGDVLLKYPQILILTDDIYENLVYDGRSFATLASSVPALYDRVLTMNGVSKTYAMTGWRIGYAGGPEWLIGAMRKVMSQSTSNPTSISQWATVAALSGPQTFLSQWGQIFEQRRDFVVEALNRIDGLSCVKPHGAFYAFANCENLLGRQNHEGVVLETDAHFAEYVLEQVHVAIVPGEAFHAPGHVRLSFASSMKQLSSALDRIEKLCERLRGESALD